MLVVLFEGIFIATKNQILFLFNQNFEVFVFSVLCYGCA